MLSRSPRVYRTLCRSLSAARQVASCFVSVLHLTDCKMFFAFACFFSTGDEVVTVKTPAFAESVTEGDVRWEKGWCV
uniref:Uncharacterized protein n=1 Tax=Neolamprologus brichardi TaxID=32507 RepID=A0A3Q4HUW5_NEOBR